ncbi:hypothetical protein CHU92_12825 [Flavobacterium cyanobacteriorum]|uniref:Uncharacterized protein n=1 Tax=Flavobacterium cyanobacteriorum TaxID=2022802 RepID=A0A255YXX1_9FLAO|nr:hypothetical protein CHU92_12825 [Flavobacterium cyanobacteriorum]
MANFIEHEAQASENPKVVNKSNPNDVKTGDIVNLHTDEYLGALSEWAKQSKPGVGEVEIHGHGWRLAIEGMSAVKEISDLLYSKSPTWKQMIDGGMKAKIKLKLYSCGTGKGKGSIAWQINQVFPNVTVVAPTDNWGVRWHRSWFGGAVKVDYGYIKNRGRWRTFE